MKFSVCSYHSTSFKVALTSFMCSAVSRHSRCGRKTQWTPCPDITNQFAWIVSRFKTLLDIYVWMSGRSGRAYIASGQKLLRKRVGRGFFDARVYPCVGSHLQLETFTSVFIYSMHRMKCEWFLTIHYSDGLLQKFPSRIPTIEVLWTLWKTSVDVKDEWHTTNYRRCVLSWISCLGEATGRAGVGCSLATLRWWRLWLV